MTYKEFYKEHQAEKYEIDSDGFGKIIEKWRDFREKILNGTFEAEDYNSKTSFFENEDDCSLRQFVENECGDKAMFGSLGTIKSSQLGLWVTGDDKNHKIYKFDGKEYSEEDIKPFTKQVREFLEKLLKCYRWEDLLDLLRKDEVFEKIAYPSFIFGMVFLNSILKDDQLTDEEKKAGCHYEYQNNLIWIYNYKDIESSKSKEFKSLGEDKTNQKLNSFIKSKALFEKCKELLGDDFPENVGINELINLESTVWNFTHNVTEIEKSIINVLNQDKQVVLTGAPGTGKTYSAKRIAMLDEDSAVISQGIDDNGKEIDIKYEFVQFHPSFDYCDFVEGLRPVSIKGVMTFVRMDGVFKEFCRKAAYNLKDSGDKGGSNTRYYFIIDEINRADLSKVFGELMYCLEYRGTKGRVKTQYSNLDTYVMVDGVPKTFEEIKTNNANAANKKWETPYGEEDLFKEGFYIPGNIYIIGTMNDIDRSVESFDFALRRRFKWIEIKASETMDSVLKNLVKDDACRDFIKKKMDSLNGFLSDPGANGMGLSEAYNIGPAYFKTFDKMGRAQCTTKFINVYKNEIEPTLREYVRGRDQESIDRFLADCREKVGLTDEYKWMKEDSTQGQPAESQNNGETAPSETNVQENA